MTRLRASLVCEGTLARDAKEINLGDFYILEKVKMNQEEEIVIQ